MNCKPLEYRLANVSKNKWLWHYPFTQEYIVELQKKIDENTWVKKVIYTIIEHIENETCTVKILSTKLFMSPSNLNRKIKKTFGISTIRLIADLRLQFAVELFTVNNTSLTEVIAMAGFYDIAHFSNCFKKVYKCTPSNYNWEYNCFFIKSINQSTSIKNIIYN